MGNLNYAFGRSYRERAIGRESESREVVLDESYSGGARATSRSYSMRKNYDLRKEERGAYADTGGGGNALGAVPTRTVFI